MRSNSRRQDQAMMKERHTSKQQSVNISKKELSQQPRASKATSLHIRSHSRKATPKKIERKRTGKQEHSLLRRKGLFLKTNPRGAQKVYRPKKTQHHMTSPFFCSFLFAFREPKPPDAAPRPSVAAPPPPRPRTPQPCGRPAWRRWRSEGSEAGDEFFSAFLEGKVKTENA